MPTRKYRDDYVQLGKSKGLQFVGDVLPQTADHPASWICITCGAKHKKTFRSVRVGQFGCVCQNNANTKTNQYEELANKLGILWIGKSQPRNTKVKTLWASRDNRYRISATYAQLSYMKLTNKLKKSLGIVTNDVN